MTLPEFIAAWTGYVDSLPVPPENPAIDRAEFEALRARYPDAPADMWKAD